MAVNSSDGPFVFRLNENGIGPHLLAQVLKILQKVETISAPAKETQIYHPPTRVYSNTLSDFV